MLKPEVKYGLLAGFALVVWTLTQYFLGFHTIRFGYFNFDFYGLLIILFISLFISLKEKKADLGGHFSIRQGMRTAMFQLFLTALISCVFMFIYDYKLNPLWIEELVKWQELKGESSLFSGFANDPSAGAVVLSNTEAHLSFYFMSIVVAGGFFTLIISAFLSVGRRTSALPSKLKPKLP